MFECDEDNNEKTLNASYGIYGDHAHGLRGRSQPASDSNSNRNENSHSNIYCNPLSHSNPNIHSGSRRPM